MNLDNPKNIWDAVSTLIDKVREQDTLIEMLKAKVELLELTKVDRAGRKAKAGAESTDQPRRRGRQRKQVLEDSAQVVEA